MRRTQVDADMDSIAEVIRAHDRVLARTLIDRVLTEEMTTGQEERYRQLLKHVATLETAGTAPVVPLTTPETIPVEVEPDDPTRCAWSGCRKRAIATCPICGGGYCGGCFALDRESHQEAQE